MKHYLNSILVSSFSLLLLGFICFSSNTKNVVTDKIGEIQYNQNLDSLVVTSKGGIIRIDKEINLGGKTLIVPPNCVLKFSDKGCITNGKVCGNGTKIYGSTKQIFDNVKILGSWLVPQISTAMFRHPDRINTLKEVVNLSSDSCNNVIEIKRGVFQLDFENNELAALKLRSRTKIVNHGTIRIFPNNLQRHYIIWCDRVDNVTIQGGKIIGDRKDHIGKDGEWGYGICATRATNLKINNVEIEQCWGDCVCLGVDNSNVTISNCKLHDSRRQGITIAGRENIKIENCKIYNIYGTEPQSAIDIEPDPNGMITNVCISNVEIKNCKVGVQVYGGAKNVKISNIKISDVSVSSLFDCRNAFYFAFADSIYVDRCKSQNLIADGIRVENCREEVFLSNNTLITIGKNAIVNVGDNPIKIKNNKLVGGVRGLVSKQ